MKVLTATSSAVVTKGYIERLLNFQIFLISRAKFSFFVISSVSVLGLRNSCIYYESYCILSIDEHSIRSVEICRFIGYDMPVPI